MSDRNKKNKINIKYNYKSSNILYIFFVMLSLMMFVSADISVSSYTVNPNPCHPGTSGAISLTLANLGTNLVKDINVFVSTSQRISTHTNIYVGDLQSSGQTVVNIPFKVDDDTNPGVYTLRLRIKGNEVDYSQNIDERMVSRYIDIPLYVIDPPKMSVSAPMIVVNKDTKSNVSISITNEGGNAKDVVISPECDNVIFYNDNPIYLFDVNKNNTESINLLFKVTNDAPAGELACPLIITSTDSLGYNYNQTAKIYFTVKDRTSNFMVVSHNKYLSPGNSEQLSLTVSNLGEEPEYNVKISFDDNDVFIPQSSQFDIGRELSPGESKTIITNVGVSEVAPGYYSIPVTISYEDALGRQMSETESFIQQVSSEGVIKIFIESDKVPIYEGGEYTFSVKVSNVGISQVKSLMLRVNDSDDQYIILLGAQSEQYIGTLDADDFSSVQYDVFVSKGITSNAPKEILIPFEIEYLDSFNNYHSEYITVPVKIYPREMMVLFNGHDANIWWYYVAAIVLVLIIIYWFYRRKKHKKIGKQE